GVTYLQRAGYDPRAMGTVLQSLAAQNALDAAIQGRDATVPEWASTHPDPAGRVQNALRLAGGGTGVTNRDTFLTRIDGLVFGVTYLQRAGYDPRAMGTVLQSLAAQNALDAAIQGRDATVPEWASTHPDPAGRVQNALRLAGGGTGVTNRDTFLTRIDGLVYG